MYSLSLSWEKSELNSILVWHMHSTLTDCSAKKDLVAPCSGPKKLPCEKQELTPDHICCLNGRNNCNLSCHRVDLIRRRTIALLLFWTSSRPMSSPWWYIIPLGRQVNYKLAPNTWRWRSPPSEGNVTVVVCVCVCDFTCVGSEEAGYNCYPNCQTHFQKSWWDTIGVHTSYQYTLVYTNTQYTLLQMIPHKSSANTNCSRVLHASQTHTKAYYCIILAHNERHTFNRL